MRGTVYVGQVRFEITAIKLADGVITIEATRWNVVGTYTISPDDPYTIFGTDQSVIARGLLHLVRPETAVGEPGKPAHMTVVIPIGIIGQELL